MVKTDGKFRILIIDDHPLVRQGLIELLQETFQSVVFGQASTFTEALTCIGQDEGWDLILLDISLPDGNGLEALTRIKKQLPATPVLVVSMHPEEHYAMRVLKAGGAGFVSKTDVCNVLVKAVKTIVEGRTYTSGSVAEQLVEELAGKGQAGKLSERELQVINLLAGGNSVKEIAFELNLSVKTVSTYRARLLKKLRLRSTVELIRYALREGLAEIKM